MSDSEIKKTIQLVEAAEKGDLDAIRELWEDGGVADTKYPCRDCKAEDKICIRSSLSDYGSYVVDPETYDIHFTKPVVMCCLTCLRDGVVTDVTTDCPQPE